MSTQEFDTYNWVPCDPSEIPAAPYRGGNGRSAVNPHADVVKNNAGTGGTLKLVIDDVPDDDERRRLINRHARYIRLAAHAVDRGARIHGKQLEGGGLQIAFTDIPYVRRVRKVAEDEA